MNTVNGLIVPGLDAPMASSRAAECICTLEAVRPVACHCGPSASTAASMLSLGGPGRTNGLMSGSRIQTRAPRRHVMNIVGEEETNIRPTPNIRLKLRAHGLLITWLFTSLLQIERSVLITTSFLGRLF